MNLSIDKSVRFKAGIHCFQVIPNTVRRRSRAAEWPVANRLTRCGNHAAGDFHSPNGANQQIQALSCGGGAAFPPELRLYLLAVLENRVWQPACIGFPRGRSGRVSGRYAIGDDRHPRTFAVLS
jgi:hypothetical protein